MNSTQFDHLTCSLARSTSRRRAFVAIGLVALAPTSAVRVAAQIAIPACGQTGDVCTLMAGCCSGLTCATSMMNPSYGVCVLGGTGGMMPVSDGVIAPTSEGMATELAQEVAAASSATITTDPDAERQARIAARKLKRSTRRTSRKAKNDTQRASKVARRTARRLNTAPRISLELFPQIAPVPLADDGDPNTPPADDGGTPELVRIRNLDDVAVVLSRIESIEQPSVVKSLSVSIPAGGTYLLASGPLTGGLLLSSAEGTNWTEENVCPQGGGVTVTAAQTGGTRTHQFQVLCGSEANFGRPEIGNSKHQKKKKQQQRKQNARRRAAHQKRRERRPAQRG